MLFDIPSISYVNLGTICQKRECNSDFSRFYIVLFHVGCSCSNRQFASSEPGLPLYEVQFCVTVSKLKQKLQSQELYGYIRAFER